MKIVIAGTGKSGTTALTYKIAAPLRNCSVVFEPLQRRPLLEKGEHTVVKMKLTTETDAALAASYQDFDRKILLVRDPRDWLVSRQLYLWYSRNIGEPDYRRFMERLERKEMTPSSVAFVDLMLPSVSLPEELETVRSSVRLGARLLQQGWFQFRYEAMVSGDFDALDAYLGFAVDRAAEVDAKHRRVVRSKSSGNWRHWLTPQDVETLRPLLSDSLEKLGYAADDWSLTDPQVLDPATGTDYVRSLRGTLPQRWYRKTRRLARRLLRY